MKNLSSLPAGEKRLNEACQQSAKSTAALFVSILSVGILTGCGDLNNWWSQDKLDVAQSGNAPVQPDSAGVATDSTSNAVDAGSNASTGNNAGSVNSGSAITVASTTPSASTAPSVDAVGAKPATEADPLVFTTSKAGNTENSDYRPDGYDTLFFSDEFNGTEIDRSKWCTRFVWGGGPPLQVADAECTKFPGMGVLDYANADEQQRYRDFNTQGEALHVLKDGILHLRATKTGTDWYLQYEAAMLNSKVTFKPEGNTSYYITTRMRLPNVLGTWPSIWLAPSLGPNGEAQWPPEIDIFEGPLNNAPETEYTLHQHSQVRGAQTDSGKYEFISHDENFETTWGYYTSPDRSLRDVWLEIAAEWTVDGVCFYIDGFNTACENYRWVANDGAPGHPANLILNLAVGGPWAGRGGIDESKFPTQLEVDYVRVYRKN